MRAGMVRGGRRWRSARFAPFLFFVALLVGLLAAPSAAFAATTWSDEFPMDLTVVSGNKPTIQVMATDSASNIVSGNLTVGGFVLGAFSVQRPDPANLRQAMLVLDTSTSAGLPWGENVVTATVRNALGQVSSWQWTFYTDAPPTVTAVDPTAGGVVRTTTNPLIRVTVADLDDTTFQNIVFRVNGGNAWGSPAYNYSYDQPTKTFSVQRKSGGWSEGSTVTVDFRCDDAAATASRTWQFRVDTRPDTQAPALSNPTPIPGSITDTRPLFSITALDNMPGDLAVRFTLDGVEVYSQSSPQGVTSWTPASDIALGSHAMVVEAVDAALNASSYEWTFTASDPNTARHTTSTPFTECSSCHNPIISNEHANRGFTCDAPCHTSTDPLITGAIAAGNTACEACHTGARTGHTALHDGGLNRPDCLVCHKSNIADEHNGDCAKCHASTDPVVVAAIASNKSRCADCHTPGIHATGFFRPNVDYYAWTTASGPMNRGPALSTIGANPANPGAHAGYLATTAKCGMCHSVHRAAAAGRKLLPTADATCAGCHTGGTAITAKIVTWTPYDVAWVPAVAPADPLFPVGGPAWTAASGTARVAAITNKTAAGGAANGGGPHNDSALDLIADGTWNGTGLTPPPSYAIGARYGCFTRRCHASNPHGADSSQYTIFAAKLLFNTPAKADIGGVGTYGGQDAIYDAVGATDAAVQRFVAANPTVMSISGKDILIHGVLPDANQTHALVAGLTCGRPSNPSTGEDECHAEASYAVVDKSISENRNHATGVESPSSYRTDNTGAEPANFGGNDNRDSKTGHVAGTFAGVPGSGSYAPIAGCTSCHDQTDAANTVAGNFTFPHGQVATGASNLTTDGINPLPAASAYDPSVRSRIWMGYGAFVGAPLTYTAGTNQKAYDGQCLKCHRDGAGNGIGLNH